MSDHDDLSSLFPFPNEKQSIFNFRIDTDFASEEEIDSVYQLCLDHDISATWFVDFVITPGLAFDIYGNRIGYGGGYYDKLLKQLSGGVTRIGVGYDFQVLNSVPHSELDKPVQFVVTETKILKCLNYKTLEV